METMQIPHEVDEALDRVMTGNDMVQATVIIQQGENEDGLLIRNFIEQDTSGDYGIIFDSMADKMRAKRKLQQ